MLVKNIYVVKQKVPNVEKKSMTVLTFLEAVFLQTRNNLQKDQERFLNFCKLKVIFKSQVTFSRIKYPNNFFLGLCTSFSVFSAVRLIV